MVVGTIVLFVLARARMGSGTRETPLPLIGGYLLILLAARKPEADQVDEEQTHTSVDRVGMFLPYRC